MIEVAAGWGENGEAVKAQLAEVDSIPFVELGDFGLGDDSGMTATEDELASSERTTCEDATALVGCLANLNIADHSEHGRARRTIRTVPFRRTVVWIARVVN